MKNKKEIYEEYLMKELRNRLTLHLSSVGEFNGKLILYGSKKDGKYIFYIRNNNVRKVKYNVDFNFSILYEDELDIIRKFEKDNDTRSMSDEEYDKKLYEIKELKYAVIDGLYINPKNTGFGTKFVNQFIDDIRKIKFIKSIYLMPKDAAAKKFWIKNGFVEDEFYERPHNLYDYNMMLNLR